MLPDLTDEKAMLQAGRIATLKAARRKAANELRDLCARMLNHIEDAPIDLSKMQEQAEIINKANEMLDELLLVK